MTRRLYLLAFIVLSHCAIAQPCEPQGGTSADYAGLSSSFLVQQLKSQALSYSDKDVEQITRSVEACNSAVEAHLTDIESKMRSITVKQQSLERFSDVNELQSRIKKLESTLIESRASLEKSLSNIKHAGIFITVIPIPTGTSKPQLTHKAMEAMYTKAVEDLNGVYIKRLTTVSDYSNVKDVIEQLVSGDMNNDKTIMDLPQWADKKFILVSKVSVTPLKTRPAQWQQAGVQADAIVLNIRLDNDYRASLRAAGLSSEVVSDIDTKINLYLSSLDTDNQTADSQQQQALDNGKEEIRKHEQDLENAKRDFTERETKLKKLCVDLGISTSNDFEASLKQAAKVLEQQYSQLEQDWNDTKEYVLETKSTVIEVNDDPYTTVGEEGLKLLKLLEQNGKVYRYSQKTKVLNLQVDKASQDNRIALHRQIQKIWVLPVPRNDGGYKVVVFARYKIGDRVDNDDASQVPSSNGDSNTRFSVNGVNFNFAFVQSGSFVMGCTDEQDGCGTDENPSHNVSLDNYYIGTTEVTQKQYRAIMGKNPSFFAGCDDCPVENVSYEDAQAFIAKLNTLTGKTYRLPTEAEWEYAARGGNKSRHTQYAGSNTIEEVAWYDGNSGSKTHSVGQKKANELGLYDMTGNVREWCSDWYDANYYRKCPSSNPHGVAKGSYRVLRGGSWRFSAEDCRVAYRINDTPDGRNLNLGFRLACSP